MNLLPGLCVEKGVNKGGLTMTENTLHRLAKSNSDRIIGGVCGGLGQHTSIPAWTWRLLFLFAFICFGTGALLYILMWIFMPAAAAAAPGEAPKNTWLHTITRSETDRKLGGVCGGLGEHSDIPSWTWRVIFVTLAFFYCVGVPVYILLWIFIPKATSGTVQAA